MTVQLNNRITLLEEKSTGEYTADTKDTTPTVIASTASPFKFANSVMKAIEGKEEKESDFALINRLSQIANVDIPNAIKEIESAEILHDHVFEISDMKEEVKNFLNM